LLEFARARIIFGFDAWQRSPQRTLCLRIPSSRSPQAQKLRLAQIQSNPPPQMRKPLRRSLPLQETSNLAAQLSNPRPSELPKQ